MNIKTLLVTFIAGFSMLMFQSVYAGSMKCGQHIISDGGRTGPGTYEVLKRCGEPTFRQGNTWVYERGEKRRVAVVFKDNGEISSINTL
ncbi:MAG: DUF2845 domain-containing protein [Gammaproteobacteria bacterium]|nr:DUF2845 domain-containing protein [Gammaproteobacteria bacterium]